MGNPFHNLTWTWTPKLHIPCSPGQITPLKKIITTTITHTHTPTPLEVPDLTWHSPGRGVAVWAAGVAGAGDAARVRGNKGRRGAGRAGERRAGLGVRWAGADPHRARNAGATQHPPPPPAARNSLSLSLSTPTSPSSTPSPHLRPPPPTAPTTPPPELSLLSPLTVSKIRVEVAQNFGKTFGGDCPVFHHFPQPHCINTTTASILTRSAGERVFNLL